MQSTGSSKRVLFVAPGWPPESYPNGVVTYIANMRAALVPHGFASSVIAESDGPPDPEIANLHELKHERSLAVKLIDRALYELQPDKSMPIRDQHLMLAAMTAYRRKMPFDLVEMEEVFGVAELIRPKLDVPIVVRLHGPWFLNGPALGLPQDEAFLRRVNNEKQTIAGAFAVSAPSQDVLDQTRSYYGIALPDAVVIPNPGPDITPAARWSADTCEPNSVLFVGRFDRHKGGDLVIDAFAQLAAKHADLELKFAGPDRGLEQGDGTRMSLPRYLEERVRNPDVRRRIHVLGPQPAASIASLRKRAALTIVASRYENAPMTIVEGLAFGSPLVVSDAGGNPELVVDGQSGLLFRAGDANDLAAKVDGLLANPAHARELAAAARVSYERRLTPSVVAGQMAEYYRSVLAKA